MTGQWGKRIHRRVEDDDAKALSHHGAKTAEAPPVHAPAVTSFLNKQRAVGNKATARTAVQTKLTVGPAGDRYEKEADRVAGDVMRNLQRQPMEEEEEMQMSRLQRQEEEEELQMKPLQRQEEEELMMSRLQRQDEEEELQMKRAKPLVGMEGGPLDADTDSAIQGARGGGRPLDSGLRRSMEGSFGADFSGVKVHDNPTSHEVNEKLQAKAFTTGTDIFFRKGDYNPGTKSGQELVAHELTHVVQQGAARRKEEEKT